ncbi:MAG: ATP-binding protein [Nitrospinaceae bacterium]
MQPSTEIGLEILSAVARVANSPLDLEEILAGTIDIIKDKLHIDACSIFLMDTDDAAPRLKLIASSGLPAKGTAQVFLPLGRGVTGWVAQNKAILNLEDALQDPRFVYFPELEEERFRSMLSVPLVFLDECIGVINVHTLGHRYFSHLDSTILKTISEQITGCIRNAVEYKKSQTLLREQTLLYQVSQEVQRVSKLEHRLWILLTGITLGEGGGFNRALLFKLDEGQQVLRGIMGVGPDSQEEANRIWSELKNKKAGGLPWILEHTDPEAYKKTAFNKFAAGLSFPFRANDNILAECVFRKQPLLAPNARTHPLVPGWFREKLGSNELAVVPLVEREMPLGAILVDNRYNNVPIREANLGIFSRLATQASWVIENARLFHKLLETNRELLAAKEQVVQSEKLAALGELSAEVAHEIKNPLVSIGGFARRLSGKLAACAQTGTPPQDPGPLARYADIIVHEVEHLETVLKNILAYSKSGPPVLEACEFPPLVHEVLQYFEADFRQHAVQARLDFSQDPGPVSMDREKVKQVLINVVFNALESMSEGGELLISAEGGASLDGAPRAVLKVEDTGGGIPREVFENIFNPFFTTKKGGTGLGLAISRKLMENQGGEIRVENNLRKGVTVSLHLPLKNGGDCTKT